MTAHYRLRHLTRYTYDEPVAQCQTEIRLRPRAISRQHVRDWQLKIEPEPTSLTARTDYFGNEALTFTVLEPHDRLVILASGQLDVDAAPEPILPTPWEQVRSQLAVPATPTDLAASEFRWESPYVPWLDALADYARTSFPHGRPLAMAVRELTTRIHRDFRYTPHSTSIETPLAEVVRERRGVCQDFAHVMIGALRSLGLAARYVSGYLRSGADYTGAEASHAWVSVYLPGFGWTDFDPTNDLAPGTGHVTLAWGRDYSDVPPVKGVTVGGGEQQVDVEVRVTPI